MVTLEINGQEINAEEGESILNIAEQNGIEIPHFCFHPGLKISGNCRLCLVEIENVPKLQISCATPVCEGMKVFTESEKVVKTRKGILEFLLINHPIDCPICDQAGECSLQDYYQKYGLYKSRFTEEKLHKGKIIDLGSGVILDQERCVLCTRCVRIMRDVAKDEQLGTFNRGNKTVISTISSEKLNSIYAGNIFQNCPVGALTSKDFRFKCRVWFLKSSKSICPGCSTGCNILIDHHENTVHRIRARFNKNVNQYWMCDIGRYYYKNLYSEHRIIKPMKRVNGELIETSYNEVISEIAKKLKAILQENAPKNLGIIGSPKLSNEDAFNLAVFARDFIKTKNIDSAYYPEVAPEHDNILLKEDRNPNTQGCRDMKLLPLHGGMRIKDMLAAARRGTISSLLIFNADLFVKPSLEKGIISALENIGLIILFQNERNEMTKYAHYLLPVTYWAEQEGTFTNFQGKIQAFNKAVKAPEQVFASSKIISDIAVKMGFDFPKRTVSEIFDAISETIPNYKDLDHNNLLS